MLHEWIRDHKKLALVAGIGFVVLLLLGIFLLISSFMYRDAGEEKEPVVIVTASNLEVLYDSFSDYTIGYVMNAIGAALNNNQSMKNGTLVSSNTTTPADSTNDSLYPSITTGEHHFTIVNNKVDSFEDDWGMWQTFTIQTDKNKRYKVNVSIGAHDRTNDLSYTQITILKR